MHGSFPSGTLFCRRKFRISTVMIKPLFIDVSRAVIINPTQVPSIRFFGELLGLLCSFAVANKASIVSGAHPLAPLGDESDKRDIAGPQTLVIFTKRGQVIGELGGCLDALPPHGHKVFDGLIEPLQQAQRPGLRLEESPFVRPGVEMLG